MKSNDKSREENVEFLAGAKSLDRYLKEISWNLRSMTTQADLLETVIVATKKGQREHNLSRVKDNRRKGEHRPHAALDKARCENQAGPFGIRRS
ncbi:hypothetical protein [Pseudolabrys sp. Root1462]|jgi:hypothetical protein|uniref:hypothetical protein n=1 Tax=Pseudolabrys sp. Root1462 TaxID=1736466 RepID=UPI0012E3D5A6|nr:hypothetical protein [Pseudolabrys sp. Root1462]